MSRLIQKPLPWPVDRYLLAPRWRNISPNLLRLPMWEGSGEARDVSGRGHDTVDRTNVTWVEGEVGSGLSFDGSSSYTHLAGIPTGFGTHVNQEPFTVLLVASHRANGTDRLFGDWNSSGMGFSLNVTIDAGEQWIVQLQDNQTRTVTGPVRVIDEVMRLAVRWVQGTLSVWFNNSKGTSSTHATTPIDPGDGQLTLGRNGDHNGGYWDGNLYYFDIIGSPLSDEAIQQWNSDPFGLIREERRLHTVRASQLADPSRYQYFKQARAR